MALESTFDAYFSSRLNVIVKAHQETPCAFFFLGLSPHQAALLSKSKYAASSLASLLDSSGFLDLEKLPQTKMSTFGELCADNSPKFLLYEQLPNMSGALGDMYPGKIFVVVNNLFDASEGYPSPASPAALSDLESNLRAADEGDACIADPYYASAFSVGDAYLTIPKLAHDNLDCTELPLFRKNEIKTGSASGLPAISVPSAQFLSYRVEVCNGHLKPISLVTDDERNPSLPVIATLLYDCGVPIEIRSSSSSPDKETGNGRALLPLLKKYWGPNAGFRELSFYKDPDIDNEMKVVSQGQISDLVVKQAEQTLSGSSSYSDVFVTAPTGAGKSLLFQLPAIYLSHRHDAVTLVIEPLKQLMIDQVANLRKRGVTCVAAINSDISYQDRLAEYERIREGKTSIIYLSPELLLASSLDTILNGRKLGLVIIDEVHTVTSWGIDFRPDYWYLGPFLNRLRRSGTLFPIFCLTATAVYGGKDDVVTQSVRTLELVNPKIFLGNPRRDDINFDIRVRNKSDFPGPIDEVKTELACKWIRQAADRNDHAIAYCPYRSHVDSIVDRLGKDELSSLGAKVMGFHAGYRPEYKDIVSNAFKSGSCRVLASTKAFGMGIDIDDINAIYHFAPTGNLADYIQEIGRGARKASLRATAVIDYFHQDNRYARQLYAMSQFSQWQLREVMGKLHALYAAKPKAERRQNILVSPNSFSYLFSNEKDETAKSNRVKAALMMIAQDLENRYSFPVLIVQPKPSYTKQFVCIDNRYEEQVLSKYGTYLFKLAESSMHYETRPGQNATKISDMGGIYLLDLARMWEDCFPDSTFAQFKHDLFTGQLDGGKTDLHMSNRLSLSISYSSDFEKTAELLDIYLEAISETLRTLRGEFTEKEFSRRLSSELGAKAPAVKQSNALLNALVLPIGTAQSSMKCVTKSSHTKYSSGGVPKVVYETKTKNLLGFTSAARQALQKLRPRNGKTARRFLNPTALGVRYELAELLQVLELASYEVRGGEEPEIFVRLNDPAKIKALANDARYSNRILRDLNDRHDYAAKVISGFFLTDLDDSERWDLVEEYFLGNDEAVASTLHLYDGDSEAPSPTRKVKYRGEKRVSRGFAATLDSTEPLPDQPYFRIWKALMQECTNSRELNDLQTLKSATRGSHFAMPIDHPELTIESDGSKLHPVLAWSDAHVLLFSLSRAGDYELAQKTNWKSYLLGQGQGINLLADDISIS